jgi:hypothetical protein
MLVLSKTFEAKMSKGTQGKGVNRLFASSLLLIVLLAPTNARADNANPPKILDLIQVTQGPYMPGDLVTYKIVYTGGNPGLARAEINFAGCKPLLQWRELEPPSEIHGNGLISFVLPNCDDMKSIPVRVQITDKTGLTARWSVPNTPNVSSPRDYEVKDYIFKPVKRGEIAPATLGSHQLDLSIIPKELLVGESIVLPEYSSIGAPVSYTVSQESLEFCEVKNNRYPFPKLPGGTFLAKKNGECKLFIGADMGQPPTYDQPTIISSFPYKKLESSSYILKLQIGKISSDKKNIKTITCKKGKITKKVSGAPPKCPKGFKLSV